MLRFREEHDSVGAKQVPANAYYGVQSLRAMENFKITGRRVHPEFVRSIVEVKKAAAKVNRNVGVLQESIADVIVSACDDILSGKYVDNFIVDSIQGGAGTSLNMNANEVVANRAIELLGGQKGNYSIVHPNDHVNYGQSTNDVYPSAGKIALIRMLLKATVQLDNLYSVLMKKAEEYNDVIKMGRTEMQDAVPISFGQVFTAFANGVKRDRMRFDTAIRELSVLNMGGTAVGTGINADKRYIAEIVPEISKVTGLKLTQAEDLIDSTQNLDCFIVVSGIIKSCAATLSKIANDLRLMSSGPRTGFGEINLPPKQNGSSIMPGKINPVIPEVISQIAFNIIGNDTTITLAVQSGQLELNAFEPIIFHCLFESLETLTNGAEVFAKECIEGITVNCESCANDVLWSMGTITALCPHIGYTKASQLAKKAMKENKYIREVLLEEKIATEEELDKMLDPKQMI